MAGQQSSKMQIHMNKIGLGSVSNKRVSEQHNYMHQSQAKELGVREFGRQNNC